MSPLEQERNFFSTHQAEWEKTYPGKFVLVKGDSLVGTFDDAESAVAEGARQFGTEPFLVRRVNDKEETVYIPALALGILQWQS